MNHIKGVPIKDLYHILIHNLIHKKTNTFTINTEPYKFQLGSLKDLHFLDWHACSLLKRLGHTITFYLNEDVPSYMKLRIAADIYTSKELGGIPYQVGAVLAHFLSTTGWQQIWHDYLTSRDKERPIEAGATLQAKCPHLLLGFVTGIDMFHIGEYYAAHEEWEALWMRLEDGPERHTAQGLIQLAGAHIHRLKDRQYESRKLYSSARKFLQETTELKWLDVDTLSKESDAIFYDSEITELTPWPIIPIHTLNRKIARKHL